MRLGIIGAGGMTATLLQALQQHLPRPLEHLAVLVRGSATIALEASWPLSVHTEVAEFLATGVEVVAECAGHAAVRAHGPAVLAAGRDLIIASTGALADSATEAALREAAAAGGARIVLPSGAIGGIDALAAARLLGTPRVTYIGRKPPGAWRGTKAETLLDLGALEEPATFYEGSARAAAQDFPQNANVAATVALAGVGFEATRVRLVADPGIARNLHELEVESEAVRFAIRLEGVPSPGNPKTSLTAGLSMARAVISRASAIVT
jgi:aspartate dehydrogenase